MTWTKFVTIGSLTCTPIHPTFGAEVEGVDFSRAVPDTQIRDIVAAQDKFGVLVFRNTGLDDHSHVRFSYQLGDLEKRPLFKSADATSRFQHPELFDIGNIDKDGKVFMKDARERAFALGNALWHTDSSFNQHRSKYSLLLAHILLTEGGDTRFADVRHAFRDLPEERKAPLRGLVARHDLWHSRRMAAPEAYKEVTEREAALKPPAYHKFVQTAPDGDETLYIASHTCRLSGHTPQDGLKIIQGLIQHCIQPQYVFTFKWKQPGDLVFWDNRQVLHAATSFQDQSEKRDMRRTTVLDDGPEAFGVPEAARLF